MIQDFLQKALKKMEVWGTLRVAFVIFSILAVFILVFEQPGSYEFKATKRQRYFVPKLFTEDISRIEIAPADSKMTPLIFIKEKEGWVIENDRRFPADPDKIEALLEGVYNLKVLSIVSKNKDKEDDFSVGENTGVRLQMWNRYGRSMADFYVGKPAGLDHQYFRYKDSSEVVEGNANLNPFVLYPLADWKSKIILSVDPVQAVKINIKSLRGETTLSQSDSGWMMIEPEERPLTPGTLDVLFSSLKSVKAQAFFGGTFNFDPKNSDYLISVRYKDESLKVMAVEGPLKDGRFIAKNGEQDALYELAPETLKSIFELRF